MGAGLCYPRAFCERVYRPVHLRASPRTSSGGSCRRNWVRFACFALRGPGGPRGWVRFARSALRGAALCPAGPNWVCFARLVPAVSLPVGGRLGSFGIFRPSGAWPCPSGTKLGLFRTVVARGPEAAGPEADVPPRACLQSAIAELPLFRMMGPWPPPTSNTELHTSNFSCLCASPYYAPCCRNRSGKMDGVTLQNRRKSLS
jgi:hypothetical protein